MDRTTIACSWRERRCSASAVMLAPDIRRRSTRHRPSTRRTSEWLDAVASAVTSRSTDRTTRRATPSCADEESTMRTTFSSGVVLVTLLATVAVADAQEQATALARSVGSVDFGARLSSGSGDEARFNRMRDLREGPTVSDFTLNRRTNAWTLDARADHVGYRDQHYLANYVRDGSIKMSFEWDQIPLNISADTRTLFTTTGSTLLIGDAIQRSIENRTSTLADAVVRANSVETNNQRDIARLNFTFTPQRDLDLRFKLSSTARNGTQVWGTSFGHSSSVELPVPL